MTWLRDGIPTAHPRAFWWGLVGLVVAGDAITAVPMMARWLGWYPATWNAIQNFNRLTDPLAAAAAFLLVTQAREFGLGAWGRTAVRRGSAQLGMVLVTVASAVAVGHLVAATAVLGASVHRVQHADGIAGLAALAPTAFASTLVWIAFGIACGRRLSRPIGLALSLLVPFLTGVWLDSSMADTPLEVLTVANSWSFAHVEPEPVTLAVRAVVWLAIAAWAIHRVLGVGERQERVLPWLVSGTVTLAILNGYVLRPIPGAENTVCRGDAPQVCTPAPYAAALPDFQALLAEAAPHVPQPLRFSRVASEELQPADSKPEGTIVMDPIDGPARPALTVARVPTLIGLGEALWPDPVTCSERTTIVREGFQVWWLRVHELPEDGSASPGDADYHQHPDWPAISRQAEWFRSASPTERDTYLRRLKATEPECFQGT